MRLDEKVAVVYGAGGPMGGAVARAFAEAGAKLYLAGRDSARLAPLADEISASAATVDVDDRSAVEQHADAVLAAAGRLDISFNVAATDDVQGMPLTDMSTEDFMQPIEQAARRNFHTMTAAARRMVARRSGAIVTLTSSAGREWRHQMGGFSVAWASMEVLTRTLAGELKGTGVRVAGIRANFTPETKSDLPAGVTDDLLADTLLQRLPRLDEVAAAAVFLASNDAGATTGSMLDVTCGAILT